MSYSIQYACGTACQRTSIHTSNSFQHIRFMTKNKSRVRCAAFERMGACACIYVYARDLHTHTNTHTTKHTHKKKTHDVTTHKIFHSFRILYTPEYYPSWLRWAPSKTSIDTSPCSPRYPTSENARQVALEKGLIGNSSEFRKVARSRRCTRSMSAL